MKGDFLIILCVRRMTREDLFQLLTAPDWWCPGFQRCWMWDGFEQGADQEYPGRILLVSWVGLGVGAELHFSDRTLVCKGVLRDEGTARHALSWLDHRAHALPLAQESWDLWAQAHKGQKEARGPGRNREWGSLRREWLVAGGGILEWMSEKEGEIEQKPALRAISCLGRS